MPASLARVVFSSTLITGLFTMITACAVPTADATEEDETTSSAVKCAASAAQKISSAALRMSGKKSQKRCYAYVKQHMRAAGMSTSAVQNAGYGGSAYMFAVWAKKNPSALAKMGLVAAPGTSLSKLPRGSVIVWARGQCGYSSQHGHIEVVVDDDSSRACSDFCGSIKKTCGSPSIFVPKGCGASSAPVETSEEAEDEPQELDNVPLPVPRPDDLTSDDSADPGGSGCFSSTLGQTVPELSCIYSQADGETEQCHDGLWYRGVEDNDGPHGACSNQ